MSLRFLGLLLVLVSLPASAQTASLVRDIFVSGHGSSEGSSPFAFQSVNGKALFVADEDSSGHELWVSDGTGAGTELLADICPGECSSFPFSLGRAGGTFFFVARDGRNPQLWRTDGTRAGTFSLATLVITPNAFAVSGRYLFFSACLQGGCGLWKSDGTAQGLRPVEDLPGLSWNPVAADGRLFFLVEEPPGSALWVTDGSEAGTVRVGKPGNGSLISMVAAGGRLFFVTSTSETGEELWTSDGTPQGTRRLTDLPARKPFALRSPGGDPLLWPAGRRVYFVADDSVHGFELWRSDGTPAGTRRLTDFDHPQPFRISERLLVEEVKDRAVFVATDGITPPKVWTSDGTSVTPLPDPCGGSCQLLPEHPQLVRAGDRVFYPANDGSHGFEMWVTDGTPRGTRMLRDLCPGSCGSLSSPVDMLAFGATVLFAARPSPSGTELFRSDGTPEGTEQITSFQGDGHLSSSPLEATLAGSRIFFAATDARGEELWVSDGGGSRLLADINRKEPSSDPAWLVAHGGQLFFSAEDLSGREVWRSDGTSAGTVAVTDSEDPSAPWNLVSAGDWLFFHRNQRALWRTDGTAAGTIPLIQDRYIGEIVAHQGRAVLTYSEGQGNWEIWRCDGTPQGTGKALALPAEHFPFHLASLGSDLYFVTESSVHWHLWRWDGTSAGATELAQIESVTTSNELRLTRVGSRVFFISSGRLWVTDGSPLGTRPLMQAQDPNAEDLAALGSHLYFLGGHSRYGLWRTDGTATGTVLVQELPTNGPQFRTPLQLVAAGSRLYFQVTDAAHGIELWTSDGTAAGTGLLRDILPGPDSSTPLHLTPVGGRLFFAAGERVHGVELWQADGTPAGTRLVQDIAPQGASSNPDQMTLVGNRLFFAADDGASGRELWTLPLSGAAGCQPSPTRLCLQNGRFQVEAVWRDFQDHVGVGQAVALTPDTGYFWFFDESNVEAIVKMLDGQGVNGHFWVFYGALSSVEYTLTVTDTQTGLTRRYHNPSGQLASVGDTRGFGPLGAFSKTPTAPSPLALTIEGSNPAAAGAPCQPTAERLCLENGRFSAEVSWKDFAGKTGKGQAVPLTAETGYFWFFDSANVEVVLKVLDGTPINGKHWVFYGALSSVEYKVTVTDIQTGKFKVYENPSGRLASVADTGAF